MAKALSGQITIATAGTAVQGPSSPRGREFILKAHPDNTGVVYVGNDGSGDVTASNGFALDAGDHIRVTVRRSLAELWFDTDNNNDKVTWFLELDPK